MRCAGRESRDAWIGVVGDVLGANATVATAAGLDLRVQNFLGGIAQAQIDTADNCRAHSNIGHDAAGGDCRHTIGKFDFADRAHRLRTLGAIHRIGFHKNRRANVVPRGARCIEIGEMLVKQIACMATKSRCHEFCRWRLCTLERSQYRFGLKPQMMVRIDDRQVGFKNGFGASRKFHC